MVHGGLTCQLAQTLGGAAVHHQAERTVLNQQLDGVEKPVIDGFHAVTHKERGKKGQQSIQCGSYYEKLLLNSAPDGRTEERQKNQKKKNNGRENWKCEAQNRRFQVKQLHPPTFVLLGLQIDQKKTKRNLC